MQAGHSLVMDTWGADVPLHSVPVVCPCGRDAQMQAGQVCAGHFLCSSKAVALHPELNYAGWSNRSGLPSRPPQLVREGRKAGESWSSKWVPQVVASRLPVCTHLVSEWQVSL